MQEFEKRIVQYLKGIIIKLLVIKALKLQRIQSELFGIISFTV